MRFPSASSQYIVAVAESLSFNRAADDCHVSQPSLSVQIAELERVLGIMLFERNHHRVALTAAGRDFVESARAVLNTTALAETARRSVGPFAGTLRWLCESIAERAARGINAQRLLTREVESHPEFPFQRDLLTPSRQSMG